MRIFGSFVSLVTFFSVSSAFAIECTREATINIEKNGEVRAVQLLKLHREGIEIPNERFEGQGLCFYAERGMGKDEETDFIIEELGNGRGAGRQAFLVKVGRAHANLFKQYNQDFVTEEACLQRRYIDRSTVITALQETLETGYDDETKTYRYRSPGTISGERREIRSVAGGKGITLRVTDELRQVQVICYYSKH